MSDSFRPQRQPLVAPGQIDHHVADMTMTASAGMTLESLQSELAKNDQWLPIDGDPKQTLGRLIETNSSGPLRLGYGAWRDLLLGMQFTTSSDQLITAGGRTMKNVAGYDLTKFMIGQYGLFGKIVTITTRTYRRPEGALLVRFEPSDKLVGQLLPTPSRPQWAMLANGFLWCGYMGDSKAIVFYESELAPRHPVEVRRQSLAEDIDFRSRHWLPDRPPVRYRASVPPSQILEFVERASLRNSAADAAFGIVVGSSDPQGKETLGRAADAIGGSVLFDDPEELKRFFGAKGAELALLERLKLAFDQ